MSLIMTEIGSAIGMERTMIPGVVIGVVGLILALINYPMYQGILRSRKKKHGAEILELSEKIINK